VYFVHRDKRLSVSLCVFVRRFNRAAQTANEQTDVSLRYGAQARHT
jgi:hypothetical protein